MRAGCSMQQAEEDWEQGISNERPGLPEANVCVAWCLLLAALREWDNTFPNFDNLGEGSHESERAWSSMSTTAQGVRAALGMHAYALATGSSTLTLATLPSMARTGAALLTCFVTVTLNGYVEVMEATMAAPHKKGEQPQRNQNWAAFFWCVYGEGACSGPLRCMRAPYCQSAAC